MVCSPEKEVIFVFTEMSFPFYEYSYLLSCAETKLL